MTPTSIDISSHPFCAGLQPKDTRMTTRIHPENILFGIGAVLHEGSHGLYAAQFFEAFEAAHPRWQKHAAQGTLDFIRDWLKKNIHKHGRQFTPTELCHRITNKPLSQDPYLTYLTKKYRPLYRL